MNIFLVIYYIDLRRGITSFWIWNGSPNTRLSIGKYSSDDISISFENQVPSEVGRNLHGYYVKVGSDYIDIYAKEKFVFECGPQQELRLLATPTPQYFMDIRKYYLSDISINKDKNILQFISQNHKFRRFEKTDSLYGLTTKEIKEFFNSEYGSRGEPEQDIAYKSRGFKPRSNVTKFKQDSLSYQTRNSSENESYNAITVFYGTDRDIESIDNEVFFRATRGSKVAYGSCIVSVPKRHVSGEFEIKKWWEFWQHEDPNKYFVLINTKVMEEGEFFLEITKKTANSALIFIHGYNVSFSDAAKRTAQICYDLKFEGAPFFFSWPSQGKETLYTVDEQNIAWSEKNITLFLQKVLEIDKFDRVYLIAHSMGNRALTGALTSILHNFPQYKSKLTEIILTAPDIDAEIFKRDIAPVITQAGAPITLYASSNDRALYLSKKMHGYKRAGDTDNGILVCNGIETIDATRVNTSFLGHSYFGDEKSVLADIYYVVSQSIRPNQRFSLKKVEALNGDTYWELLK